LKYPLSWAMYSGSNVDPVERRTVTSAVDDDPLLLLPLEDEPHAASASVLTTARTRPTTSLGRAERELRYDTSSPLFSRRRLAIPLTNET
jgi:hypothetical protein